MKKISMISLLVLLALGLWLYLRPSSKHQETNEKVLELALTANIKGMDPAYADDVLSNGEMAKVYESLFSYHYLKRPYELIPNLAAAMPDISADELIYTVKIQQGVKFQDDPCFPGGKGRELVAEDFVYAIKRIADPKVQSTCFSLIDGRIKGLNEWRENYVDTKADYTVAIEGLEAPDKYTLVFKLTKPFPQFIDILAKHFCAAVPREAITYYQADFINHPVGTGPFTLKEFSPQANKLVYHKNPNYRVKLFPSEASEGFTYLLSDAGKQLPLVDKVVMHLIPEEHPRWLKFQKGQLDFIQVPKDEFSEVFTAAKQLAPAMQKKQMHLLDGPSLNTYFIAFNHLDPLFRDNLTLRRAMAMAYDRQSLNDLFYKGMSVVAQSITPPGVAGYRPDYTNPYGKYDLARAKQLLAEAGYPAGKGLPEITLDTAHTTTHRQIGEHFAACMAKLGIPIKVITNPWPELQKKVSYTKSTMLYIMGWQAGYADAEIFLSLLYGPFKSPGRNGSNFDDPAYNALYEQVAVMRDSPARTELYEKMNQLAAENVPLIYMVHKSDHILHHSWLQNATLSDFSRCQEQYLNIDMDKKRAMKAQF
jgi:ABC-type transport system substrate-binding protein